MSEENRKYIKDEDYVELNSLDAAHRYADDQKRNYKAENKRDIANSDAIAVMMPEDKINYLKYGMNLLIDDRRCTDKEINYMRLFIAGCSNKMIAAQIGQPLSEVESFGKDILHRVQDAIQKTKSTRIPIVGG